KAVDVFTCRQPFLMYVLTFYDFFNLPRSKKRCFSHSLKNYFIHAYLLGLELRKRKKVSSFELTFLQNRSELLLFTNKFSF
ncbi:MAG: hypothetical protein MR830_00505, partial [Succinatimonas sp.]|nr:hypothetical protein [Succinatimonas sp.]